MCHAHPPTLVRIKGTKNLLELLVRRPMKKENIGEEKREIVSKVNRCNWPDSWIDEKRYTGKMEKADITAEIRVTSRNQIREGVDQTNANQSNDLSSIDSPFRVFPQQFSIYLSPSKRFLAAKPPLLSYSPVLSALLKRFLESPLLNHRQTDH